jgi:hypothetical protein
MMSTKMICGFWSAILASASKPSVAVVTSAPSRLSRVSAVRRMVFESSITITRKPPRLPARLSSCVISIPPCAALRQYWRRCKPSYIPVGRCTVKHSFPRGQPECQWARNLSRGAC